MVENFARSRKRDIANLLKLLGRFSLVGVAATILYFLLSMCLGWLLPAATALQIHLMAMAGSVGASYLAHHGFTYRVSGHNGYAKRFAIVTFLLFVVTTFAVMVADQVFGWPHWAVATLVTVMAPPLSFILHTFWTFDAGDLDKRQL